jgi:two-component system, chemotaxis family, response regulator Rcp1
LKAKKGEGMKAPMNGRGKLIGRLETTPNQPEKTPDDSRDGIMAQRNLSGSVILLVEDNRGDVALLKRAFTMAGLEYEFLVASNGQDAIGYLSVSGSTERVPAPTHVLLDIDVPRRDGLEVLAWIRANSRWSNLPVIVLSGSDLERHISQAKQFGIDACLPKGVEFADTKAAVARIAEIWNLPTVAGHEGTRLPATAEQS